MMFSCRDQESSVQFVEPVQTSQLVPHDELVVHEVGDPGDTAASRSGSASIATGAVSGGGGTGIGPGWATL